MSVHWTPIATGVPHARAGEMQGRLEAAGIGFLPTETTSWIGKLRAFVANEPDISLFVDKEDVDRARPLIAGLYDPQATPQSLESYLQSLNNEQLQRLLKSTGWPDLVLDPARQLLRERTLPPAPVPKHDAALPVKMALLAAVLGPIGSWISRQIVPRAQPWEDKMIPVYDPATQAKARQFVTFGLLAFTGWFLCLFVVKCVR
ncbi:MAG: hypothetical protein JWO94_3223 [Verrucomicrobiaceae bacterium]|nr:hypothetical protein [Verrucomicrobiaceae bacterium]